jgi:hypothetical protein
LNVKQFSNGADPIFNRRKWFYSLESCKYNQLSFEKKKKLAEVTDKIIQIFLQQKS